MQAFHSAAPVGRTSSSAVGHLTQGIVREPTLSSAGVVQKHQRAGRPPATYLTWHSWLPLPALLHLLLLPFFISDKVKLLVVNPSSMWYTNTKISLYLPKLKKKKEEELTYKCFKTNCFVRPEQAFVFAHRAHLLGFFLWTEELWNEKHPSFDILLIKKFKYRHKCLWPNSEHMKKEKGIDRSVIVKWKLKSM